MEIIQSEADSRMRFSSASPNDSVTGKSYIHSTVSDELTEIDKLAILLRTLVQSDVGERGFSMGETTDGSVPTSVDGWLSDTSPNLSRSLHNALSGKEDHTSLEDSESVNTNDSEGGQSSDGNKGTSSEKPSTNQGIQIRGSENLATVDGNENSSEFATKSKTDTVTISQHEMIDSLSPLVSALSEIAAECETRLQNISNQQIPTHSVSKPRIVNIPVIRISNTSKHRPTGNSFSNNCKNNQNIPSLGTRVLTINVVDCTCRSIPEQLVESSPNLESISAGEVSPNSEQIIKTHADCNNNNSIRPSPCDHHTDTNRRTKDPTSVSATLVITYPFISQVSSVQNPYRRMICNPAPTTSSQTGRRLRRTISDVNKRKGSQSSSKPGRDFPPQIGRPKAQLLRSNSCLAALGNSCLPVTRCSKENLSNHGRSWYEGLHWNGF